jgi:hypothetical protein
MGHYRSDFLETKSEFCGWEYPHPPHTDSSIYYEVYCAGFDTENARNYVWRKHQGRYDNLDYWICPDCGSMVIYRETHDRFHRALTPPPSPATI